MRIPSHPTQIRRMLAIKCGAIFIVGPDNGLLDRARRGLDCQAVQLDPAAVKAPTFESRDVMAPAAAALAIWLVAPARTAVT